MQYSKEVEDMICVAKGPNHGPAPIPEEGKWIQAKKIEDISGYTHGVGWCAPVSYTHLDVYKRQQEYGVEIVRCFAQSEPSQKGMILRVTDERLLEKTVCIVQGMSGSPILQDGRIIGAVTHVYLSDATQGYGMYIEWMLEKSDAMDASEQAV